MSKIADYFCRKIPGISNDLLLFVLEILRKIHRRYKYNSFEANRKSYIKHIKSVEQNDGYIENQSAYTDLKYGKYTIDYSGCEVIAVYNVLNSVKDDLVLKHDFPKLISIFEKDGCMLSGMFGTSPKAIYNFFVNQGYVTAFSSKERDFQKISEEYDSFVLTFYNDRNDIRREIHTVNVSKFSGKFLAHNVYCNGLVFGPFESIGMLLNNINGGNAKGISLVGIKKKEK